MCHRGLCRPYYGRRRPSSGSLAQPRARFGSSAAATGEPGGNTSERPPPWRVEPEPVIDRRYKGKAGVDRKVLVIYTGGTIGMAPKADGSLAPEPGYLEQSIRELEEIKYNESTPLVDLLAWPDLIDSSEMNTNYWDILVQQIKEFYFDYDGFVVLHGTDTMAYTASALSFMLENLGKPVILTGSQMPFSKVVNDARRNLLVSIIFAGMRDLPEVCIFFDTHLLRGNRTTKSDSTRLNAFTSPNMRPLATLASDLRIRHEIMMEPPKARPAFHTNLEHDLMALHLTPGFSDRVCEAIKDMDIKGLVLRMYGAGNAPSRTSVFLDAIRTRIDRGTVVVACTQCQSGGVDLGAYEVGMQLKDMGVISASDMTIEATVTKLSYLIAREVPSDQMHDAMQLSLRGELTSDLKPESYRFLSPFDSAYKPGFVL